MRASDDKSQAAGSRAVGFWSKFSKNFRLGLFGALFVMSKSTTVSGSVVVVGLVVRLVQMLSFILTTQPIASNFRASIAPIKAITSITSPTQFLLWMTPLSHVILFFSAVVWTTTFLLLTGNAMHSFIHNSFTFVLPFKVLRVLGQLSSGIFLIPLVSMLMSPITCGTFVDTGWAEAGYVCSSKGFLSLKVISSILTVLLFSLCIIFSLVFYDSRPLSRQLIATAHGRADVIFITLQLILVLVCDVFSPSLSAWVVVSVQVAAGVVWVSTNLFFMPFYRHLMNTAHIAIGCIYLYGALCNVFNAADYDMDAAAMIYMGAPLAGLAGIALSNLRASIIIKTPAARLNNVYEVELKARYALHMALWGHPTDRILYGARAAEARSAAQRQEHGGTHRATAAAAAAATAGRGQQQQQLALQPGGSSASAFAIARSLGVALLNAGIPADGGGGGGSAAGGGSSGLQHHHQASSRSGGSVAEDEAGATDELEDGEERMAAARLLIPPEAIEEALAIYKSGISRFRTSSFLHILMARFYISYQGNRHMQMSHLLQAERRSPPLDVAFLVFQARKQLEGATEGSTAEGGMSAINRVTFEKYGSDVRRHVIKASNRQVSFWMELCAPTPPDLGRLHHLGSEMNDAIVAAENAFRELLAINASSLIINRLYAAFNMYVTCNTERASVITAEADRLEDQKAKDHKAEGGGASLVILQESSLDVFTDSTAVITVSGNARNLGTILAVNNATMKTFGASSRVQFERRPLFTLFPYPFNEYLEEGMRLYIDTGEGSIVDYTRIVFGRHAGGSIMPLLMSLREGPTDDGPLTFVISTRTLRHEDQHILMLADFTVVGASQASLDLLNIDAAAAESRSSNIRDFVAEWDSSLAELQRAQGCSLLVKSCGAPAARSFYGGSRAGFAAVGGGGNVADDDSATQRSAASPIRTGMSSSIYGFAANAAAAEQQKQQQQQLSWIRGHLQLVDMRRPSASADTFLWVLHWQRMATDVNTVQKARARRDSMISLAATEGGAASFFIRPATAGVSVAVDVSPPRLHRDKKLVSALPLAGALQSDAGTAAGVRLPREPRSSAVPSEAPPPPSPARHSLSPSYSSERPLSLSSASPTPAALALLNAQQPSLQQLADPMQIEEKRDGAPRGALSSSFSTRPSPLASPALSTLPVSAAQAKLLSAKRSSSSMVSGSAGGGDGFEEQSERNSRFGDDKSSHTSGSDSTNISKMLTRLRRILTDSALPLLPGLYWLRVVGIVATILSLCLTTAIVSITYVSFASFRSNVAYVSNGADRMIFSFNSIMALQDLSFAARGWRPLTGVGYANASSEERALRSFASGNATSFLAMHRAMYSHIIETSLADTYTIPFATIMSYDVSGVSRVGSPSIANVFQGGLQFSSNVLQAAQLPLANLSDRWQSNIRWLNENGSPYGNVHETLHATILDGYSLILSSYGSVGATLLITYASMMALLVAISAFFFLPILCSVESARDAIVVRFIELPRDARMRLYAQAVRRTRELRSTFVDDEMEDDDSGGEEDAFGEAGGGEDAQGLGMALDDGDDGSMDESSVDGFATAAAGSQAAAQTPQRQSKPRRSSGDPSATAPPAGGDAATPLDAAASPTLRSSSKRAPKQQQKKKATAKSGRSGPRFIKSRLGFLLLLIRFIGPMLVLAIFFTVVYGTSIAYLNSAFILAGVASSATERAGCSREVLMDLNRMAQQYADSKYMNQQSFMTADAADCVDYWMELLEFARPVGRYQDPRAAYALYTPVAETGFFPHFSTDLNDKVFALLYNNFCAEMAASAGTPPFPDTFDRARCEAYDDGILISGLLSGAHAFTARVRRLVDVRTRVLLQYGAERTLAGFLLLPASYNYSSACVSTGDCLPKIAYGDTSRVLPPPPSQNITFNGDVPANCLDDISKCPPGTTAWSAHDFFNSEDLILLRTADELYVSPALNVLAKLYVQHVAATIDYFISFLFVFVGVFIFSFVCFMAASYLPSIVRTNKDIQAKRTMLLYVDPEMMTSWPPLKRLVGDILAGESKASRAA